MESQCKYADEIDQDTPDSSASRFNEPSGLNREAGVEQGRRKAGEIPSCPPKRGQRGRRCLVRSSIVCDFMVYPKIDSKQIYCSYSRIQKIQNRFL